ncbi:hypothetical protein [Novosphingobium sp.]|uniref:hypothetical protein n=1 Tax=Novosphingobium sp. TaxID=1874826 RepID=UPI0038B8C05F
MTVTLHVAGKWPVLLLALPMVVAGVGMMWRPAVFALWQARFYRKRYGIVAGPIGPGTRLFYRAQGVLVATLGIAIVVRAFWQ